MAASWEKTNFTVQPYFKGTENRGHVIGSVEEIVMTVDNDTMNLQSMSGSRFAAPFLSSIQQWEKDLSVISETIEVGRRVQKNLPSLLVRSVKTQVKTFLHPAGMAAGAAEVDLPGEHLHQRGHPRPAAQGSRELRRGRQEVQRGECSSRAPDSSRAFWSLDSGVHAATLVLLRSSAMLQTTPT